MSNRSKLTIPGYPPTLSVNGVLYVHFQILFLSCKCCLTFFFSRFFAFSPSILLPLRMFSLINTGDRIILYFSFRSRFYAMDRVDFKDSPN